MSAHDIIVIKRKTAKEMISEDMRASSLFSVMAFEPENDLFYCEDGAIGFGFQCHPLSGADEKIASQAMTMLNEEFVPNTQIQIIHMRSPDIQPLLHEMQDLRHHYNKIELAKDTTSPTNNNEVLERSISDRAEFLHRYTNERMIINDSKANRYDFGYIFDLKLLVTVKIPIKGDEPTEAETAGILGLKTKIQTTLNNIHLHPKSITADVWIRFMNTVFNRGENASWRHNQCDWDDQEFLCNQVVDFDTAITISKNNIKVGENYIKCLSAKRFPNEIHFGEAMNCAGDMQGGAGGMRHYHMIVTNILIPAQEGARKNIERKRAWAIRQTTGGLGRFLPQMYEKAREFDHVYESLQNGSQTIRLSYHVVVFGDSEEDVNTAATTARNFWRTNRFEIMEDNLILMPVLLNCLPFCSDREAVRDLNRFKTMTAKEAAPLMPIFGEWKGTQTPHMMFISRNGQLMKFSLHDTGSNMNAVIAAQSGSGKSVLANEIIISYLSEGAQVWTIDAGKSYKKICSTLDGDFIQFDDQSQLCLNPFQLIVDYQDEEDGIISLVSAMAASQELLSDFQISMLRKIMREIWDAHHTDMTIDQVADECIRMGAQEEDKRISDIGRQLFNFTSQGGYGRYFSGKNNISFTNDFTVLELDELQGRKHLRTVVLLQLIYQIQQQVYLGDIGRKKVIIIDEAWDLLKGGDVAVFMEHAYRKFRKYNASIVICTQSLSDLYDNAVGRAVGDNSATTLQLGQKSQTLENMRDKKILTLNDYEFKQLRTVRTIQEVYSEIYIMSDNGHGIARLMISEYAKLLYSTQAKDVHDIAQLEKEGMSTAQAIMSLIELRKRGGV